MQQEKDKEVKPEEKQAAEPIPEKSKPAKKKVNKKAVTRKATKKKTASAKGKAKKKAEKKKAVPKPKFEDLDFKRVKVLESEEESRIEMYFKDMRKVSVIKEKDETFAIVLKRVIQTGEVYSPAKTKVDARAKVRVGVSEITLSKKAIQAIYLAVQEFIKRGMF